MINIRRGEEPKQLVDVRLTQLNILRALGRAPISDEITGYRCVSTALWRAQFFKCCYCERKIPEKYHDVEHYRPKASASRAPGCTQKHGYWWLAFSWENLLFACPACNRSGKNDAFPLARGSTSLQAESEVFNQEIPLLLNPSNQENPVEHLEFYGIKTRQSLEWWARGRNGSVLGETTLSVLKLNSMEYREMRRDYFETTIKPSIVSFDKALKSEDNGRIKEAADRAYALLNPKLPYVGLSFDALRFFLPGNRLIAAGLSAWPNIEIIGRMAPKAATIHIARP